KHFDPELVSLLALHAGAVFAEVDGIDTWQAVIDGEPALTVRLSTAAFDAALEAIANFVDLKSPFTLGHSGAVADLAAAAGRLDGDAVRVVLDAADHRPPRRQTGPAGLTRREMEVLVLLSRGLSNKQIANQLVISPKTAGNHIEHIYTKIGASNRASAGLFA